MATIPAHVQFTLVQIWDNISYEVHDDLHNVVTNTNNAYLSTDGVIGARSIELQFEFSS